MPQLSIASEIIFEFQNEGPERNARIEIKSSEGTFFAIYEAVIVGQKGADGKIYPIVAFREVPIEEGQKKAPIAEDPPSEPTG